MATPAIPLKEFDVEMASTRRLLERVPGDKASWKPHEKSFPLGHLAQLVSLMPGWMKRSLNEPQLDLAKGKGYSLESHRRAAQDLRRERAGSARGARGSNGSCARRAMVAQEWRSGAVHGAAPLPSVYGPTADEAW